MFKFFKHSLLAAAFMVSAHSAHSEDLDIHEKGLCSPCPIYSISTNFSLTSVDNIDYTFSATPVSNRIFSIDSNGTITLPGEGDYLINFSLIFSTNFAILVSEITPIYFGEGAIILTDSSTGKQVGTALNFLDTQVIHAKGPVTVSVIYRNFGSIPMVPLHGFMNIVKIRTSKINQETDI